MHRIIPALAALGLAAMACTLSVGIEPPTPALTATPTLDIPTGWVISEIPDFGLSLRHPPEWQATTSTAYTVIFAPPPTGPQMLPPLYVSLMPADLSGDDAYHAALGYVPPDLFDPIFALESGEGIVVAATFQNPDYSTFTRLENTPVDGQSAAVIENTRVWEALEGTRERRVLVTIGDRRYVIGTYYFVSEARATFESVLATVEVAP